MKLKSKLIGSGLVTAVTCALIGSITGTFAWYGYSTRATAAFTGTAIQKAANLQIGIVEANASGEVADALQYLQPDGDIHWSPIGGGLNYDIIGKYLEAKGHSINEMRPTTSGRLENDGVRANPDYNPKAPIDEDNYPFIREIQDIQPKEMSIYQYNSLANADAKDYVVLPLALRVSDLQGNYLKNTSIYVSDLSFDVLAEGSNQPTNIGKAMRIDFKTWNNDENITHKIVSPKADADGSVKLGGLLDLNLDGYVDVEQIDYGYRQRDELIYGAVKGEGYQEYKNIANPSYYSDKEEKVDGSYIRLNDGQNTLVDQDLPEGTYYSQFLYNKIEEANQPVKYELAYSLQDANTIEYTQKVAANPFLDPEENYGEGKGHVYYDTNKIGKKLNSPINSVILVENAQGEQAFIDMPDGKDFNDLDFDASKLYKLNSANKYYVAGDNAFYEDKGNDAANYCYFEKENGFGICLIQDDPAELINNYAVEGANSAVELKQRDSTNATDDDNDYNFKNLHVANPEHHENFDIDADHPDRAHKYIEKEIDAIYEESDMIPLSYERIVHLGDQKYHQINTRTVESYEAFEQKYISADNFTSVFDAKGRLDQNNANEFCDTGDEALVYCTLTMWIEGWDKNCDDTMLGVEYGLGIQFQIDRVD